MAAKDSDTVLIKSDPRKAANFAGTLFHCGLHCPQTDIVAQIICEVPGGVNAYLLKPDMLVNDLTRLCPICLDHHRLQLHGWYDRYGLFPHPEKDERIAVRRLLCPVTGRTVSLLPDFCIPRRQHGPAILGPFLVAVILQGVALLAAIRSLRPNVECHSVAQSLLRGFVRRDRQLRAYLSQRSQRLPEAPKSVPVSRRPLAELVIALQQGASDIAAAFIQHGRSFHRRFELGLA